MMARIACLVIASALATGCAAAISEFGFGSADTNDDDTVSRAEFGQFADDLDLFPRYDDDDDGYLDRGEYAEAVDSSIEGDAYFRGFDRDRDNRLTSTEFNNGIFESFDRDRNGWLNENEFESAVDALAMEL